MEKQLRNHIREFILQGTNEKQIKDNSDPFWQNLRKTGTEIWLDTGDMEEAAGLWSSEMTALTTNNTLINKEIQKGIYDDFIGEAKEIVKDLPLNEQVMEIAFILNARHGLRLAQMFGGFVSVELHTDTAHDIDAIVEYGQRYHEINPDQFIVKVPYTADGLIGARKLRELGIRINFTLEFSARQNVMVAMITRPNYQNVFLGRIGAYIKENGLGDGSGAGERAVLSSQQWINKLTAGDPEPTKLIAASLRNEGQLETLAGVNVFTMPTKVAKAGKAKLSGNFVSNLDNKPVVGLNQDAGDTFIEKVWEVSDKELSLTKDLAGKKPESGKEIVTLAREYGCDDMFPSLSQADADTISADGKIPKHEKWASRIASGELAVDTLLNLAGLASFATDQQALDERVKGLL